MRVVTGSSNIATVHAASQQRQRAGTRWGSACVVVLLGVYFAAVRVTRRPWLAPLASGLILRAAPGRPVRVALRHVVPAVAVFGVPTVVALAVVVPLACTRGLWWRHGLVALLVPLALALLAFVALNPDWMVQYRFATPVWMTLTLLAVLVPPAVMRGLSRSGKQLLTAVLVVSLLVSGANMVDTGRAARDTLTVPMCYVADRLGRTFNGYADILGLREGSFLLPDLGGSSLTSRLHLVDMAGLVTPRIARFIRDDDMAGLRDHVFEEIRPTFVHSRGPWADGNGITSDPRMRHDYYALYTYPDSDPPNGDRVRKSAVDNADQLERLRAHARSHAVYVDEHSDGWQRRHRGDTLSPGQTTVGTT